MKTRAGFISNSSSSSFVIAYKIGTKCSHCKNWIQKDAWNDFTSRSGNLRNETKAMGAENVIKELVGEYAERVEDYIEEKKFLFQAIREAEQEDRNVSLVRVDTCDEDKFYSAMRGEDNLILAFQGEMLQTGETE